MLYVQGHLNTIHCVESSLGREVLKLMEDNIVLNEGTSQGHIHTQALQSLCKPTGEIITFNNNCLEITRTNTANKCALRQWLQLL